MSATTGCPLYLHLTPIQANAFFRFMVTKLGEKPRMGKDRMLLQILERIKQNKKCTQLIIDEAHLIDPHPLTDLRLLISSIDERISLKIVLCGQDSLRDPLSRASQTDLAHRINMHFALHALSDVLTARKTSIPSIWSLLSLNAAHSSMRWRD
ncbi:hypothetical protein DESC_790029 [Desulfosarcina cetonica]|uniref:AAA family ATPase n=1 Tax=Desulfosarcina cetonica TaxID=90730 RepID=UPI0006CFAB9C|nr:AAA family ATPase [Desulfosarcina cetonica]VTR70338.1 hypothetical protein DESC_790029 [Desulfosarcina cetonica]